MMKMFPLLLAVLSLIGCAKPPNLNISVTLEKQSADLVFVKVKVVNTEDRATVPIAIELTGQAETNGHWDKPGSLLHPAAFVLNRKEVREITKFWLDCLQVIVVIIAVFTAIHTKNRKAAT